MSSFELWTHQWSALVSGFRSSTEGSYNAWNNSWDAVLVDESEFSASQIYAAARSALDLVDSLRSIFVRDAESFVGVDGGVLRYEINCGLAPLDEAECVGFLQQTVERQFYLETGPLASVRIAKLESGPWLIVACFDHLIADARGIFNFFRGFRCALQGAVVPVYAILPFQKNSLARASLAEPCRKYYEDVLVDGPHSEAFFEVRSSEDQRMAVHFELETSVVDKVRHLAATHRITLASMLQVLILQWVARKTSGSAYIGLMHHGRGKRTINSVSDLIGYDYVQARGHNESSVKRSAEILASVPHLNGEFRPGSLIGYAEIERYLVLKVNVMSQAGLRTDDPAMGINPLPERLYRSVLPRNGAVPEVSIPNLELWVSASGIIVSAWCARPTPRLTAAALREIFDL